MKSNSFRIASLALAALLVSAHGSIHAAIMTQIDLRTPDTAMDTTDDGAGLDFWATTTDVGASGTGTIETFLTFEEDENNRERGYNFNTAVMSPEYDEDTNPGKQAPLSASDVPMGSEATFGDLGGNFGELLLDVNEGGGPNSEISLVQLQVFAATADYANSDLSTFSSDVLLDDGTTTLISFADDPNTAVLDVVEVFQLSNNIEQFEILIDGANASGSGQFDFRFFFDLSIYETLDPSIYTNFIIFAQMENADGGFDEWSVSLDRTAIVPEPSTWALLLMTACGALFFQYRKKKLATAEAEPAAE